MAQREIGHFEKSILIPPVSREILDYKTQPELFRDDAIESTKNPMRSGRSMGIWRVILQDVTPLTTVRFRSGGTFPRYPTGDTVALTLDWEIAVNSRQRLQ